MKYIKHHSEVTDKDQELSKDTKKQDLIKPKTDKKLDAEDSLTYYKFTKRFKKPSNRRLSSETQLSDGKADGKSDIKTD
jgi:hypothetical protein